MAADYISASHSAHHRRFTLGVAAMDTKVKSKPMQAILKRLAKSSDFLIVTFPEQMLLTVDPKDWPPVDCLIAFHSTGYPLEKVQEYVRLFKPVTLNDVNFMQLLRSRADVLRLLRQVNIPTPSHIVVDHSKCVAPGEPVPPGYHVFEEHYDYIVYDGLRINKPFIEKSIDAEDHNNYVYYSRNTGGGCKKLFRKIGDRSSEFYPDLHKVRRDGTYIYEEFLATQGTDVKVYTVGQLFAHAEARKSPTLDGRVQRTADGKEVRYPVILTEEEKVMAYKIVEVFKQRICGFDILRTTNGHSVVCDVNGWSFVKGNVKYFNDCAHIIRILLLSQLQEKFHFVPRELPDGWSSVDEEDALRKTFAQISTTSSALRADEVLRSVVVVMRHADRKPKQKLKFIASLPEFLDYHQRPGQDPSKEVKLKSLEELQELLNRTRSAINRLRNSKDDHEIFEDMLLLQSVLERGDGFTGINRKLQIKPTAWDTCDGKFQVTKQMIVAKWDGELTRVGRAQAEDLGLRLRVALYPTEEGGLLRLHSTFRHDFKIYTSDEGRCQVTSAAFTKGFLDLEGELTPILVQMVTRGKKAHTLLDAPPAKSSKRREYCKSLLDLIMNQKTPFVTFDDDSEIGLQYNIGDGKPKIEITNDHLKLLAKAFGDIRHPRRVMDQLRATMNRLLAALEAQKNLFVRAVEEQQRLSDDSCRHESISRGGLEWRRRRRRASTAAENRGMVHIQSTADLSSAEICVPRQAADSVDQLSSNEDLQEEPADISDRSGRRLRWEIPAKPGENCATCRLISIMTDRLREIHRRWTELSNGWYDKSKDWYDVTKIPDLVDSLRYDLIHSHGHIGTEALAIMLELYKTAARLNLVVAPAEYGITPQEKVEVGIKTVCRLVKKIVGDILSFRDPPPVLLTRCEHSSRSGDKQRTPSKHILEPSVLPSSSNTLPRSNSSTSASWMTRPKSTDHQGEDDETDGVTRKSSAPHCRASSNNKQVHDGGSSNAPSEVSPERSGKDSNLLANSNTQNSGHTFWLMPRDVSHAYPPIDFSRNPLLINSTSTLWGHQTQPGPGESSGDGSNEQNELLQCPVVCSEVRPHPDAVYLGYSAACSADRITSSATDELEGSPREAVYVAEMSNDNPVVTEAQQQQLRYRLKAEEARQMGIRSPWHCVRSRFYIASASHILCLLNILRYGGTLFDNGESLVADSGWDKELSSSDIHYLSHIVFRVWEKRRTGAVRVEVLYSSGARDGFGNNYDMLKARTTMNQKLFQQHLHRILVNHNVNDGEDNDDGVDADGRGLSPLKRRATTPLPESTHLGTESTTNGSPQPQFQNVAAAPPGETPSTEVPPYCEIAPMLRLHENLSPGRLEQVLLGLVRLYHTEVISSEDEIDSIVQ